MQVSLVNKDASMLEAFGKGGDMAKDLGGLKLVISTAFLPSAHIAPFAPAVAPQISLPLALPPLPLPS